MSDDPSHLLWLLAAAFALLALFAGWADHRRGKRRNLDKPGWVPWQLILVLSMMASVVCAALGVLV
jgi:membrane protease YdiL (CAAX protease family)